MIEDGESVDSDDFLKVNNDNNGYQDSFSDSGSVGESFYVNQQNTSNFEDESLLEQSDLGNRQFSDNEFNSHFENQANNSNGNIDLHNNFNGKDDLNNNLYDNDVLNTYNDNDLYDKNLNTYNDNDSIKNDVNLYNQNDLFDDSENSVDTLPNNTNEQYYFENDLNDNEIVGESENPLNLHNGNFQNSESDFENPVKELKNSENDVYNFKNPTENQYDFKNANGNEMAVDNKIDNGENISDTNPLFGKRAENSQNNSEEGNFNSDVESRFVQNTANTMDENTTAENFLNDTRTAFQNKLDNALFKDFDDFEKSQNTDDFGDDNFSGAEIALKNRKETEEEFSNDTVIERETTEKEFEPNKTVFNPYFNDEDIEEKENTEKASLSGNHLKEENEKEIDSEISESEKKAKVEIGESEKKTEMENDESQADTEEESDESIDDRSSDKATNDIKPTDEKNQNSENTEDFNDGKEEIKNRSININLTNQFLNNLSMAQSNEKIKQEQPMPVDTDIEKKGNKNILGKYSDFLDSLKTQAGVNDKKEDNLDIESDDSEDDADNTENIKAEKEDLSESDELNFPESKVYDNSNAENKNIFKNSVDEKEESEPKQEQQTFDPGAYLKNVINQNQNSENDAPKDI